MGTDEAVVAGIVVVMLLAFIANATGRARKHAEPRLLRTLCIGSVVLPILWPFAMAFALFGKTNDD